MHRPDSDLVAECARLLDRVQELEARTSILAEENAALQDRVEEVTERAARSRDSVVTIRERLREVRAARRDLLDALELSLERHALDVERSLAYQDGMARAQREALTTVLDRLAAAQVVRDRDEASLDALSDAFEEPKQA